MGSTYRKHNTLWNDFVWLSNIIYLQMKRELIQTASNFGPHLLTGPYTCFDTKLYTREERYSALKWLLYCLYWDKLSLLVSKNSVVASFSIKLKNRTSKSMHILADLGTTLLVKTEKSHLEPITIYFSVSSEHQRTCLQPTKSMGDSTSNQKYGGLLEKHILSLSFQCTMTCSVHLSETAEGPGACKCLDLDPLGNAPGRRKRNFPEAWSLSYQEETHRTSCFMKKTTLPRWKRKREN